MKTPLLQVVRRRGAPTEAWLETTLGDDWMVAYRLHVRGESAEVAEVRVFPNETHLKGRTGGHWSVDQLGEQARVPKGGVSARLLKTVRLGYNVRALDAIMEHQAKDHPGAFDRGMPFDLARLTPHTRGRDSRRGTAGGRGRPPLPDKVYADVAGRFAAAFTSGSKSPTADVARELGLSHATVRGRLQVARDNGLLTRAGKKGCLGGELTPRGRKAWSALRRGRKKR